MARRPRDLGCGDILGQMAAQHCQTSGTFKHGAVPEQRLALRKAKTNAVRGELQPRLIAVEKGAFKTAAQSVRPDADGRAGHQPGVRPPGRDKDAQIIRGQQQIAVGHADPIRIGGAPAFVKIVQLWISRDGIQPDQQPRG